MRAYLDIETTHDARISVIGIYRHDSGTTQLIDGGISDVAIYQALEGVEAIVTFNGASFDLPRINALVGIQRQSAGIHGSDAPRLWHRYEYYRDRVALETLLHYNREDVVNLYKLEAVLE